MKKILYLLLLICAAGLQLEAQNIGINATGALPHASAMLDVSATDKGMLIPRMTTAQRTAIATPAKGLLVFDNETTSFWFYNGAAWTELIAPASGSTSNWTLNGANIYNNNVGNVGIGTNTPATKFTIQTGINTTGWTHVGRVNGIDSIVAGEAIGGVSTAIGAFSEHTLRLVAGALGRIQVYPTGAVVIGDNNAPSVGRLTVKTTNNADGISHIGENGNILKTRMGGTSAGIGTFSNTHMRIFANSISAITITGSNGNVGVGIDFPVNKFEVNGTIRSKEIIVEAINWPDYVFDKKYKLPTLNEVEKYIDQNKHLPNIPSAAEIEKNGLHLGDTQKKMIEKIEELTLYLIKANKNLEKAMNDIIILQTKLTSLQNEKPLTE
jgi:hypothetical protein